jgi:hypothetical protein
MTMNRTSMNEESEQPTESLTMHIRLLIDFLREDEQNIVFSDRWSHITSIENMKTAYLLILIGLAACAGRMEYKESKSKGSVMDSAAAAKDDKAAPSAAGSYSNARFRNVTVVKTGEHKYSVSGEGQLFEANVEWVVEDGHNELAKGFTTANAGAPDWGSFEFTVEVKKQRENSTLMLVLFESSAKDGSRQHELPVKLD